MGQSKREVIFQVPFFRCYLSFRECNGVQIAGVQFAYYEFQYISIHKHLSKCRSHPLMRAFAYLMAKELGAIAHGESLNTWLLWEGLTLSHQKTVFPLFFYAVLYQSNMTCNNLVNLPTRFITLPRSADSLTSESE